MNVNQAVRALRRSRRESQQAFATRLGLSISTIGNYERKRHPDTRSLILLTVAAREAGREDLVAVFSKAMDDLGEELGIYSIRDDNLQLTILKEFAKRPLFITDVLEQLIKDLKRYNRETPEEIARLEALLDQYSSSISRVRLSGPGYEQWRGEVS